MRVTVLSSFTLIVFIVIVFTSTVETFHWTMTITAVLLIIPSCFLPIWLEKKLCPKPIERKEKYTNDNGQQRMKFVYEFIEV